MAEKRLLSVDDDPQVLAIIEDVAVDLGFTVETLSESARFMTTYVRLKPHLITLDVLMPDLDGIEVVRWLDDIGSTAGVILLSGAAPMMRMGQKLAAAKGSLRITVLAKPFALDDLRQALAAAAGPSIG
jgi:two-component system OmpR family response regulator